MGPQQSDGISKQTLSARERRRRKQIEEEGRSRPRQIHQISGSNCLSILFVDWKTKQKQVVVRLGDGSLPSSIVGSDQKCHHHDRRGVSRYHSDRLGTFAGRP